MSKLFSTVDWAKGTNVYEVNIRQYTPEGTFRAFEKHLPRLRAMNIATLWFMPVTPISKAMRQGTLGSYYACSSYTAVNPEFGTLEDFKALVQQAHALGMKVIIDWVANHTGWDHHWTTEHPDWYVKDATGNFTERNGWHDVIDLDYAAPGMRTAMIEAMQYWITTCDIDGFRCDMAHLVPLDFWIVARQQCDRIKPLYWLAECEEVAYHDAFDTSYAWWWMHVTEKQAKGTTNLSEVREVLHAYTQYPPGSSKLFFTSNHDENSWNGTEYEKYGGAAAAWAVFTCTWQGIPLVYSGQESPGNKRLRFFDKDLISWQQPLQLADFYTILLGLRNTCKAVTGGETFILPSDHSDELMAYLRRSGDQVVLVMLNLSAANRLSISVAHDWLQGDFRNIFSGMVFGFKGNEAFELQAGEYVVYVKM
ncbi:MAG: alpha-amylase family glycosyl hydrolase [Sediminibacterium sp.]